jgi:hypothetical protein
MQLSIPDKIWNRAAMESGGSKAREGDRALSDLLLAHGMVMNGGLGHALEALSENELAAAARGYRFFGLDIVASLIENSIDAPEDEVDQADVRYGALIPSDQTLVDRFEAHYDASPHDFALIE